VSAPLFPNDANDADKGAVESLHGGAKEDGEKQCGNGGRKQHKVWQYLTPDADPCKNNLSMCKHCSIRINHHKKREVAISHLNRCGTFRHLMNGRDFAERPTVYESNKTAKRAGAPSLVSKAPSKNSIVGDQSSIRSFALLKVDSVTRKKFQKTMAYHYFVTGTSFQRIEDRLLGDAI
jgi:hypothetical protein